MGSLNPFKKPDTSALAAQEAKLAEQEKKQAAEETARKKQEALSAKSGRQARQGSRGQKSLLSGLETGVAPVEEKRGSLG